MDSNFVKEIEKAEQRAATIVDEAFQEAKDKVEQSKKIFKQKLESERQKSEQLIRDNRIKANQKNQNLIEMELQQYPAVQISDEAEEQAVKKVLERIVSFFGNS